MIFISSKLPQVAAAILIGGKSTRFQSGNDKGLYKINSKPMISFQIDTVSKLNLKLFLVAHSMLQINNYINSIDYTRFTGFIIDEKEILSNKSIHAPMIGLYSVFKNLDKLDFSKVLLLSCDLPLVRHNLLEYLLDFVPDYDLVIPRWNNGYLEPLCAFYPIKKGLEKSKELLKKNKFKLLNLIDDKWNVKYVSIERELVEFDEELISFTNINEYDDIQKIQKYL